MLTMTDIGKSRLLLVRTGVTLTRSHGHHFVATPGAPDERPSIHLAYIQIHIVRSKRRLDRLSVLQLWARHLDTFILAALEARGVLVADGLHYLIEAVQCIAECVQR